MHVNFSEKISFQYENLHLLWISRASWRKNLVTLLEPGGKKRLLGGKKWLLGGNKWLLGGKNGNSVEKSCYFLSFYMTSTRKLNKNAIFKKYELFSEK